MIVFVVGTVRIQAKVVDFGGSYRTGSFLTAALVGTSRLKFDSGNCQAQSILSLTL
jgi:hypothetical protein